MRSISREDVLRAADVFLENGVFIGDRAHSTPSSRRSFSMSTSRAAIASKSPAPRAAGAGAGLEADHLDEAKPQGQAWGLKDHRVVTPRHPAGGA